MMNLKLHVDSVFLNLGGVVLVITGIEFHVPIGTDYLQSLLQKPSAGESHKPCGPLHLYKARKNLIMITRHNINQFQFA
jgi:hypothetical protein